MKIKLILVSTILLICSCHTFNHKNPYPDMETVKYGKSQAYVFENETTDKLIINIEGSGWESVLGIKNDKRWLLTMQGAQLLQVLGDKYTFLIPEKLGRQPGLEYSNDLKDRENYTSENLVNCYMESINGYLSEKSFSSIVIIGTSEGAALLPLVYERIIDKENVKAMVSFGYGGLSLYESYNVLTQYSTLPDNMKVMYNNILQVFHPESSSKIDTSENYYGLTYKWFNSFLHIRPFDHYKNIDIPILFIHGDYDINVPVYSTVYIQNNLPEKNFEYSYYPWPHQYESYFDTIRVRNDIAEWIQKVDLN